MTTSTRPRAPRRDALAFLDRLDGPLSLGAFIRAIREGEGWTLEEMATKLDVSAQHVCDIEKGRRAVAASRAARWALLLGYDQAQMVQLALQAELVREGVPLTVEVHRGRIRRRRPAAAAYRARSQRK
jgi:transcriptional regulator with XRE-family HTH domain